MLEGGSGKPWANALQTEPRDLISNDDLWFARDREVHGIRDEALLVRDMVKCMSALRVGAGDYGNSWTQHDAHEPARSVRPLFHHAFRLIGIRGDDDLMIGCEM